MTVVVTAEDPAGADALALVAELSAVLTAITGASGQASFDVADVRGPRACFALARDAHGRALGCGALRRWTTTPPRSSACSRARARAASAARCCASWSTRRRASATRGLRLSTRRVNERAVAFYERHGYRRIAGYGRYAGSEVSVCFEKRIADECRALLLAAIRGYKRHLSPHKGFGCAYRVHGAAPAARRWACARSRATAPGAAWACCACASRNAAWWPRSGAPGRFTPRGAGRLRRLRRAVRAPASTLACDACSWARPASRQLPRLGDWRLRRLRLWGRRTRPQSRQAPPAAPVAASPAAASAGRPGRRA